MSGKEKDKENNKGADPIENDNRILMDLKHAIIELKCNQCDNGYEGRLDGLDLRSWFANHLKAQGHCDFNIKVISKKGYVYKVGSPKKDPKEPINKKELPEEKWERRKKQHLPVKPECIDGPRPQAYSHLGSGACSYCWYCQICRGIYTVYDEHGMTDKQLNQSKGERGCKDCGKMMNNPSGWCSKCYEIKILNNEPNNTEEIPFKDRNTCDGRECFTKAFTCQAYDKIVPGAIEWHPLPYWCPKDIPQRISEEKK